VAFVVPAAQVAPIELLVVLDAKQNQEPFLPRGLLGLQRVFVVRPALLAERQPHVRAHTLLDDLPIPDGPLPERILLEASVPDQIAPEAAVAGMVDVLEEMPVHLLIDPVDYRRRIDRKRHLLLSRSGGRQNRERRRHKYRILHWIKPPSWEQTRNPNIEIRPRLSGNANKSKGSKPK